MSMTTAFFFVEGNRARLAVEAKCRFNPFDRRFEVSRFGVRRGGRIETKRKEILLAANTTADRVGFIQSAAQIPRAEAAKAVDLNMVVLFLGEMEGELLSAAAIGVAECRVGLWTIPIRSNASCVASAPVPKVRGCGSGVGIAATGEGG